MSTSNYYLSLIVRLMFGIIYFTTRHLILYVILHVLSNVICTMREQPHLVYLLINSYELLKCNWTFYMIFWYDILRSLIILPSLSRDARCNTCKINWSFSLIQLSFDCSYLLTITPNSLQMSIINQNCSQTLKTTSNYCQILPILYNCSYKQISSLYITQHCLNER